jgi:hypothetical protein
VQQPTKLAGYDFLSAEGKNSNGTPGRLIKKRLTNRGHLNELARRRLDMGASPQDSAPLSPIQVFVEWSIT